jgi:hypothetical protein
LTQKSEQTEKPFKFTKQPFRSAARALLSAHSAHLPEIGQRRAPLRNTKQRPADPSPKSMFAATLRPADTGNL